MNNIEMKNRWIALYVENEVCIRDRCFSKGFRTFFCKILQFTVSYGWNHRG